MSGWAQVLRSLSDNRTIPFESLIQRCLSSQIKRFRSIHRHAPSFMQQSNKIIRYPAMTTLPNEKALGQLIRGQRRMQRLRQDDLAAALGTSHVFLRKLERGEVQQVQRLFAVLADLGITLHARVPGSDDAAA